MQWLTDILPWVQAGLSAFLVALILLQRSEAGLGAAFGDSSSSVTRTRRGGEKIIFETTIIMAILFAAVSMLALMV